MHLGAPFLSKPEIVVHALFSMERVHLRYNTSHRSIGFAAQMIFELLSILCVLGVLCGSAPVCSS